MRGERRLSTATRPVISAYLLLHPFATSTWRAERAAARYSACLRSCFHIEVIASGVRGIACRVFGEGPGRFAFRSTMAAAPRLDTMLTAIKSRALGGQVITIAPVLVRRVEVVSHLHNPLYA
jgi:hypothetical protein